MLIGMPGKIKNHEYRVGIIPAGVASLVAAGHKVRIQSAAEARIGFPDEHYRTAPDTRRDYVDPLKAAA